MLVGANLSGRGDLDYIDTSAYRFEAVVDYCSFRIETATATQFRYIQEHLAERIGSKPHIEPIDPDTGRRKTDQGGTTTVFHFRVYDRIANNSQALVDFFGYLATKFPLVSVPLVTGLEIAFDAYSRGRINNETREAARWFMEHLSAPGENVRQYDPSRRTRKKNIMFDQEPATLALNPELNLRTGNQGVDLSFQVYWKRTDKPDHADGGRPGKALPLDQWRARAEFTLQGEKLAGNGISTLDDLAAFDLARLAKYLRFANLKTLDEATAGMESVRAASIRAVWDERAVCLAPGWSRRDIGPDGYRRHTTAAPLDYSRYTTPNEGMNRIVKRKFAELGRRYLTHTDSENKQEGAPKPLEPA